MMMALTCLCLLLGSASLSAQEADGSPAPSTGSTSDSDTAGETAQPATTQSGQDPGASADAAASRDPFDYESSEQISEDLSVSFPVDI
jgi:hypothetical protein